MTRQRQRLKIHTGDHKDSPALAPFLTTTAPFALITKYGHDKVFELAEKRILTKSLVGVLAAARVSK